MAMFASLIIRLFQLVFLAGIVFFSHNKSAGTVFRFVFSAKRMGPNKNKYGEIGSPCLKPLDGEILSVNSPLTLSGRLHTLYIS